MQFDILTIFPDLIHHYANDSILGRAQKDKKIKIVAHNFRDYSKDKHGKIDDRPFGGGPGMILQIQPIYDCLKSLKVLKEQRNNKKQKVRVLLMDPAGKKFDEKMAARFSKYDRLVLIAGRYEGFDARINKLVDERVSVGDYVLAGGELPALTIVEATARLLPGVLGNDSSLVEETHTAKNTRKEYAQYTRPEDFNGLKVPKVLLSGDHKKIGAWRKKKTG